VLSKGEACSPRLLRGGSAPFLSNGYNFQLGRGYYPPLWEAVPPNQKSEVGGQRSEGGRFDFFSLLLRERNKGVATTSN